MATQKFDKLNNLRQQAIPFEEYFGEMDIDEEDRERRVKLANQLDDMFFYFLAMLDEDNEIEVKSGLKYRFKTIVANFFNDVINYSDYIDEYVETVVDSIVDTTLKNANDEWYKSQDRATYLAEGNTNPIANYYKDRQALIDGKTRKKWGTILDGKERHTHFIANAQDVPIGEAFVVGDSRMMFPGDISLGASLSEIIGCRCSCYYY